MTEPAKGTVLVAIDGSRNSIMAAGVGSRMAQLLGMHVGLLNVLDVPVLSFWVGVEARLKDDIRVQAEAMLADISEKIRLSCDVEPKFYIADGEPADEIRKVVRAHPEIIMVVTGRDGVGSEKKTELLRDRAGDHLGAKLADMLPVPVLVVPPDVSRSMICESLEKYRKESGA
jgi:nucleotide-binding universal stress UspA family protein